MQHGIYQIRNLKNSKRYVGSAAGPKGLDGRWAIHKSLLKSNEHHSIYLQRAWNKYGEESFIFEILLYCEAKDCLFYEQIALDHYKPEYNICKVAGSRLGVKITEETRQKCRVAKLGKRYSNKTRQLQSAKRKGSLNVRAILNEIQVATIKTLLKNCIDDFDIADRFGVSVAVIRRIKYNKNWRHVVAS